MRLTRYLSKGIFSNPSDSDCILIRGVTLEFEDRTDRCCRCRQLAKRLGATGAAEVLVLLLGGKVPEGDLVWTPYRDVLFDIGDGHAEQLMSDEAGRRLDYWPRVWAARSLAYVDSKESGSA